MTSPSSPAVVLVIAGNDPSGGAGLIADLQTITALGGHPAAVVTALTVQDTVNAWRVEVIPAELVVQQAETVLADLPVAAIKLGLLGNAEVGRAVAVVLAAHPQIPVVLDPVLTAGGGGALAEDALIDVYLEKLLPLATVVTPNEAESRRLVPAAGNTTARAALLLARGCRHVLIKGADEDTPEVNNSLFSHDGSQYSLTWPRLPGRYHGSGCTLASAIATLLARGHAPRAAVEMAQRYTWETLKQSWQLGKGQRIPNRQAES